MKSSGKNSRCAQFSDELMRLFDEGSLEDPPQEISAHLATCSACQEEYEALRRLGEGLGRISVPDPGELYWVNFLPRLRQRMESAPALPRRRDAAWIPSAALAILFVLVLVQLPTPIAPPSWYRAEADYLAGSELTELEYEQLDEALADEELAASYLDDAEMRLIEEFSGRTAYSSDDPVDMLVDMDGTSVDDLLAKLKDRPIITS